MKRRVISLFLALIFAFTLGAAAWADAEPLPEANAEPAPEASTEPAPEASAEPAPEASTEPAPEASAEPAPETSTEPVPEASTEPEPEASTEPAPEASTEPAPEASAEPAPEVSEEPAPEASTEPAPEASAEPAPEASAEPAPEASAEPAPEASAEPEPEASTEPAPEASAEPAPEASTEPEPEASAEPAPEASAEPEADEAIAPAAEEPVTGNCGSGTFYELIGGELHIKHDDYYVFASVYGFWNEQSSYDSWYPYVDQITRIVVEDGVRDIYENAFRDLTSVTSVELAESVEIIGEGAFAGCTALTSAELAESVEAIGENAFSGCTALTDLTVRNALCSVGIYWSGDDPVICPATTTIHAYENSMFHLYAKEMGNPFVSLGQYAASGTWDCSEWSEVPGSGAWTLTGDGVLTVSGTGMLSGYFVDIDTFVTSVVIEDGISCIGPTEFGSMENLVSVTLPSSVKRIAVAAFAFCPALKDVLNPDGTPWSLEGVDVGIFAFRGTPWLEDQRDADGFLVIGGVLIDYKGPGGDIRVPDGVTVIGEGSGREMWECDETLTSVVIPPSVQRIEERAFWGCTKLAHVELSEGLTSIQYGAFGACESLTSINLPSTLTYLGNSVFDGAGLTSVTIPAGVSTIEYEAFSGCGSLASVSLPEGLQTIEEHAFDGTALTSVTIPESVTSVGEMRYGSKPGEGYMCYGAFNECPQLTSITILNKDCDMCLAYEDESYGDDLHTRATVRGHAGSTARAYAKEHGYTFVSIDLPADSDTTGDGKTDLADVTILFERLCDLSAGGTAAVPDLCEDGKSDLKDITALYQLVSPAQG